MIRVIINGAFGRMGQATQRAIQGAADCTCVATLGRSDDLTAAIQQHTPDLVIDFTLPDAVYANTKIILDHKTKAVIGTSGLTAEQITDIETQANANKIGVIIAPNFSISAILMMRFAKAAAPYFPKAEIIEMHHDKKVDAPSGTAVKTAEMIQQTHATLTSSEHPARGASFNNTHIHSVRLPGIFAKQDVIFGGIGETLTISQNSMDRDSMMPGVLLACRKVMQQDRLIYGLEDVI